MTSPRSNHPLPSAVHFFKIIPRTSLQHGILKIPGGKYADGMSNPMILKPADGTEWKIYWTNHDGEIWFQKGWKDFATYYSLDHGYLLMFESQGTSHFHVHIFDTTGLEIDYAQPSNKMKTGLTTNVEKSPNEVNLQQCVQSRSTKSQKAKSVKHELDEDEDEDIFNTECPEVKHPSFRLVMKPSFISGDFLEIPPEFAERYLKKTHAIVILEILDGRTWSVIYSAPRIRIYGGWLKFALENNLNVGDVCTFELIQKIQVPVFKVSILRVAEEPSFPISQDGGPSQRSSKLESDIKSKILKTRALEEASKFSSEYPFFKVTLTRQNKNITRRPHLPIEFVRKHFPNMNQKVMMIQFKDKLWPVKVFFNEHSKDQGLFSAGWSLFAKENKLQPGDVCIFELINREDAIFDFHVFSCHSKAIH